MLNRLLLVLAIAFAATAQPVVIRNVRVFDGTRVVPNAPSHSTTVSPSVRAATSTGW